VVELLQNSPLHPLGRLPLTGPLNIGRTRPTGLAYSPERGLLAVSTRSGSIHMIELTWRARMRRTDSVPIATGPSDSRRQ
jgi:glycerol-3-phosphate acyltransferase PlsY